MSVGSDGSPAVAAASPLSARSDGSEDLLCSGLFPAARRNEKKPPCDDTAVTLAAEVEARQPSSDDAVGKWAEEARVAASFDSPQENLDNSFAQDNRDSSFVSPPPPRGLPREILDDSFNFDSPSPSGAPQHPGVDVARVAAAFDSPPLPPPRGVAQAGAYTRPHFQLTYALAVGHTGWFQGCSDKDGLG
jgi:hypothetical protein